MRKSTALIAVAVGLGTVAAASAPALAAQQQQTGTCGGMSVTITTPNQNSSEHGGWSVGQIVDGRGAHLIPTSFSMAVTDTVTGDTTVIPFGAKGGGNANHNQTQVTCSFPDTDPADAGLTVGDVEGFTGMTLPGDPQDPVTLAFQVSAVPQTR